MRFGLVDLPSALPDNHKRVLLSGTNGMITEKTIKLMRDLVTRHKRDFEIRKLVGQLVFQCPPKDYYCYAKKAHEFCRDQIRYVFDPSGVELLENPVRILESKVADCDSIVILMASLCENMGFPCRFVTIKADKNRPQTYSHVFLEVKIPGQGWVGSDPTQPQRPFGWEPGEEYPRKTWAASADAPEDAREGDDMAGLYGLGASLPDVQETPGVLAEKPFEFRDEPSFITVSPEELELSTLLPLDKGAKPVGMPGQSFFIMDPAEAGLPNTEAEAASASVEIMNPLMEQDAEYLTEMGALPSGVPTWVWYAGAGLLALWLLSRGKKR